MTNQINAVRDEARRRLAVLHGGHQGSDVAIRALNSVIAHITAPTPATMARLKAHVALLERSSALQKDPPINPGADAHWQIEAVETVQPVADTANLIVFEGHGYHRPDLGRLALVLACANAAIAAGVQGGNRRWHHGTTDFTWQAADGTAVPMDAPTALAFGAKVLSTI